MSGAPLPATKKYTLVSRGIWKFIKDMLTLVPERSTGSMSVPLYKVPAVGDQPSNHLSHDVGTLPATDLADARYWKRDHRRHYPQRSVFDQSSVAGLLLYGSEVHPRIAKGDAGTKQLATVANGEVSLTSVLGQKEFVADVFDQSGMPPLPTPASHKTYTLLKPEEHGIYDPSYPVRHFK